MFLNVPRRAIRHCAAILVLLTAAASADDAKTLSWEQLLERRNEVIQRLQEIQKSYRDAAPDEQAKMEVEFETLASELRTDIISGLEAKLPEMFASKGNDPEVLQVASGVLQLAFRENDYPKTLRLSNEILKVDPNNRLAANMGGVAKYATHDFQGAVVMLEQAQQRGLLIDELGGRYLDFARDYVDYWKEEQAIREAEAKLSGDQRLPRVQLTTNRGNIVVELFEDQAPNTVANFISLVESGFYNGLKFHRVIPTFMAQGGCPHSREGDPGQPGTGGPGYNIKCECYLPEARRHFGGSLSMAHAGRDTGGSQFFITHLPTPHLDREVAPQSVHTVFGRVVEGMDAVAAIKPEDTIESAEVLFKRPHEYKPETIPE